LPSNITVDILPSAAENMRKQYEGIGPMPDRTVAVIRAVIVPNEACTEAEVQRMEQFLQQFLDENQDDEEEEEPEEFDLEDPPTPKFTINLRLQGTGPAKRVIATVSAATPIDPTNMLLEMSGLNVNMLREAHIEVGTEFGFSSFFTQRTQKLSSLAQRCAFALRLAVDKQLGSAIAEVSEIPQLKALRIFNTAVVRLDFASVDEMLLALAEEVGDDMGLMAAKFADFNANQLEDKIVRNLFKNAKTRPKEDQMLVLNMLKHVGGIERVDAFHSQLQVNVVFGPELLLGKLLDGQALIDRLSALPNEEDEDEGDDDLDAEPDWAKTENGIAEIAAAVPTRENINKYWQEETALGHLVAKLVEQHGEGNVDDVNTKGVAAIEAFVAAGANPNLGYNEWGVEATPLAACFGDDGPLLDVARVLIKVGADINRASSNGTALRCAVNSGSKEAVDFLLAAGAVPSEGTKVAAVEQFVENLSESKDDDDDAKAFVAKAAIACSLVGVPLPPTNEAKGDSATAEAAEAITSGDAEALKASLAKGADVKATVSLKSLLGRAAAEGDTDIVQILLDAKADPNDGGWLETPPIVQAMKASEDDATKALVSVTNMGWRHPLTQSTVLHEAAEHDTDPDIVKEMLAAGADPCRQLRDYQGRLPIRVAKSNYADCKKLVSAL